MSHRIARGARLTELLKQVQYAPLPVEKQVLILFAATNGYVDAVPIEALRRYAESTPAIATALNPYIGYDRATEIVKEAVASRRTIREVALEKGVEADVLDRALDLAAMARGESTAGRK